LHRVYISFEVTVHGNYVKKSIDKHNGKSESSAIAILK